MKSRLQGLAHSVVGGIKKHLVDYDLANRKLRFSHHLISTAAGVAAFNVSGIKKVATKYFGDRFELTIEHENDLSVTATIIPRLISVSGEMATIQALVPGGIQIAHRSLVLSILAKVFDRLFKITSDTVNRIEGCSLEGDEFRYQRRLSSFQTLAILAQKYGVDLTDANIPMRMNENWLELELAEIINEGIHLNPDLFTIAEKE